MGVTEYDHRGAAAGIGDENDADHELRPEDQQQQVEQPELPQRCTVVNGLEKMDRAPAAIRRPRVRTR